MAAAVSPTRQGVLGITRTSRTPSPAASCTKEDAAVQSGEQCSGAQQQQQQQSAQGTAASRQPQRKAQQQAGSCSRQAGTPWKRRPPP